MKKLHCAWTRRWWSEGLSSGLQRSQLCKKQCGMVVVRTVGQVLKYRALDNRQWTPSPKKSMYKSRKASNCPDFSGPFVYLTCCTQSPAENFCCHMPSFICYFALNFVAFSDLRYFANAQFGFSFAHFGVMIHDRHNSPRGRQCCVCCGQTVGPPGRNRTPYLRTNFSQFPHRSHWESLCDDCNF